MLAESNLINTTTEGQRSHDHMFKESIQSPAEPCLLHNSLAPQGAVAPRTVFAFAPPKQRR